jgi:hypothetical protein
MSGTSKATVAGVLDIASGISAVIGAAVLGGMGVIGFSVLASEATEVGFIKVLPLAVLGPLALLLLVAGVVAIVGGIAALRCSSWGWAVAGSVASLFAFLPAGIAAVILTILAEEELRAASQKS